MHDIHSELTEGLNQQQIEAMQVSIGSSLTNLRVKLVGAMFDVESALLGVGVTPERIKLVDELLQAIILTEMSFSLQVIGELPVDRVKALCFYADGLLTEDRENRIALLKAVPDDTKIAAVDAARVKHNAASASTN